MDDLIKELSVLIEDLGFDYDRMSQAGQQTYDQMCSILARLNQ